MREPKNAYERKLLKDNCVAGYRQEMEELYLAYGCTNVEDIYYGDHLGVWIVTFKNGEDQEFDTKEEALEWIKQESAQP